MKNATIAGPAGSPNIAQYVESLLSVNGNGNGAVLGTQSHTDSEVTILFTSSDAREAAVKALGDAGLGAKAKEGRYQDALTNEIVSAPALTCNRVQLVAKAAASMPVRSQGEACPPL